MIKIGKFLYIHWLFIPLLIFCYINRQLENLVISYIIITIHELSHFTAARFIGLSCSHITVYPFGLNLKLKNTIIYNLSDEIILYLSGPLSNILMALGVLLIGFQNENLMDFYYKNLALFLINILPIVPLDGGMVVKKILNYRLGYDGGNRAMRFFSLVFMCVILALFAAFLCLREFNPSFLIFCVFIIGNIIFSKEKYDTNLLKELLYAREKKDRNKVKYAKVIGANSKATKVEIAKKFRPSNQCFVFLIDDTYHIKEILSKEEIIDDLLKDII